MFVPHAMRAGGVVGLVDKVGERDVAECRLSQPEVALLAELERVVPRREPREVREQNGWPPVVGSSVGTAEGARRRTQRAEAQRRRTDRAAACRARLDARRRRRTRLNRPRRLTAWPHYPTAPALRGSGRRGRRRRRSRRRCPQPAASLYRAQRRAVRAPRSRRQRRCSRDIREHSSDTCHSHVPAGSECPSWPCPAATCSRPAR